MIRVKKSEIRKLVREEYVRFLSNKLREESSTGLSEGAPQWPTMSYMVKFDDPAVQDHFVQQLKQHRDDLDSDLHWGRNGEALVFVTPDSEEGAALADEARRLGGELVRSWRNEPRY